MQTWLEKINTDVPRKNYPNVYECADDFNGVYALKHREAEDEMVGRFVDKIREVKSKFNLEDKWEKLAAQVELEITFDKIAYEYVAHIDPEFQLELKGSDPKFHRIQWTLWMDDKLYVRIWPLRVCELTNVTIDMRSLKVDVRRGEWMAEK